MAPQASCWERLEVLEAWEERGAQGLRWCRCAVVRDGPAADPAADPAALASKAAGCRRLFEELMCARGDDAAGEVEAAHGRLPEDSEVRLWVAHTRTRALAFVCV